MKKNINKNLQKTFRQSVAAIENDLRHYEGELDSKISHNEKKIAKLPGDLKAQVDDFERLVEQKFEQLEKILTLMDKSIQRIMKSRTEKGVGK